MIISVSIPSSLPSTHGHAGFLLFVLLLAAPFLPPGEEGSSALETLCVGLTVSSLRRSGCFHNYWRHLDQLERCFAILQGLAQVQDLKNRSGKELDLFVKYIKFMQPHRDFHMGSNRFTGRLLFFQEYDFPYLVLVD